MKNDKINRLMEEYRILEDSAENKRRKSMWQHLDKGSREQWRATPKSDYSWKTGRVPITADIQTLTWSHYFGFDINDYYFNPEVFVENYLKIMIFRFKNFPDDTFLEKWLPMWGSTVLEGTLFGVGAHFTPGTDPCISSEPIISEMGDLKKIVRPDFYASGIMPRLLRTYEGARKLVDDDFEVLFPEWIRSVFGVAICLRGYSEFLMDLIIEPEFAHEQLRLITDAHKNWFDEMYRYLGIPRHPVNLFNDEVNVPSISPEIYREMIFPYEAEISKCQGGISYWHSCGNVTKMVHEIAKLPNLGMFNVGPWTGIYEAGCAFQKIAPIEICMNPESDILRATPEDMHKKIAQVLDCCRRSDVAGMGLKVSAVNAPSPHKESIENTIAKVRQWTIIARAETVK
ncbi:MAG: uroporphyrinogen decarboxylase family protein [Ruthenibacterium sp.]